MGEILLLPTKPRQVSHIRSRNHALEILVPKMLEILWAEGRLDRCGRVTATIEGDTDCTLILRQAPILG
jgi:hypothetical protein